MIKPNISNKTKNILGVDHVERRPLPSFDTVNKTLR